MSSKNLGAAVSLFSGFISTYFGFLQADLYCVEAIEEVYLVARILKCLQSKPQCILDINFVDLIDSMMGLFHDKFPNESASLASSWSEFSGGLSLFLHKFLSMQDCFYHSAEGPCLEISFNFQYTDWAFIASGDVMWQPPNIRFLHVPMTRASGEAYRITPFIWKGLVSPARSPGCDGYVDRVDYKIEKSPATFTWDPAKGCFHTVVRNVLVGPLYLFECFECFEHLQADAECRADRAVSRL